MTKRSSGKIPSIVDAGATICWGIVYLLVWIFPTLFGEGSVRLMLSLLEIEALCLIIPNVVFGTFGDPSESTRHEEARCGHLLALPFVLPLIIVLFGYLYRSTDSCWSVIGMGLLMLRHLWLFRSHTISRDVIEDVTTTYGVLAMAFFLLALLAFQLPVPRLGVPAVPFTEKLLCIKPEGAYKALAQGFAFYTLVGTVRLCRLLHPDRKADPGEMATKVAQLMSPTQGQPVEDGEEPPRRAVGEE